MIYVLYDISYDTIKFKQQSYPQFKSKTNPNQKRVPMLSPQPIHPNKSNIFVFYDFVSLSPSVGKFTTENSPPQPATQKWPNRSRKQPKTPQPPDSRLVTSPGNLDHLLCTVRSSSSHLPLRWPFVRFASSLLPESALLILPVCFSF